MPNQEQRTLLQLIAENGQAGRQQWQDSQSQQRQQIAAAITQMLGGRTGQGPSSTLLYPQAQRSAVAAAPFAAQREATLAARTPSFGKGSYGPTQKGAYSGYKTSGDLKAAARGVGVMRQAEDQQLADQAMQAIMRQFEEADQGYLTEAQQAQQASEKAMADWEKFNAGRRAGSSVRAVEMGTQDAPVADRGADVDVVSVGARSPYLGGVKPADAEEAADREYLRDYAINQEQHIGDEWNRYLQQMVEAQQPNVQAINALTTRPLGDYAREAAIRDLGIAPELAYGFFEPAKDRSDYAAEQDLESWQQFGMPYSAYTKSLAEQAAEQQALQADAINQAIYGATGYSGQQLASKVGLAPQDLLDVLSSPEYADAYDAIVNAGAEGDPTAAWETMQMATATDPRIARILELTAGQYVPKGYDFYGNPLDEYGG